MLGIEIARIDGVPLIVEHVQFWHQASTPVMQERPASLMFRNELGAQPVESSLKTDKYRIQCWRWPHAGKTKLQRTLLRRRTHMRILLGLDAVPHSQGSLPTPWPASVWQLIGSAGVTRYRARHAQACETGPSAETRHTPMAIVTVNGRRGVHRLRRET